MKSTYTYIYDYIPVTTQRTEEQDKDRNIVLDFLDGDIGHELKETILIRVKDIIENAVKTHVIAFIPAWSQEQTIERFSRLAAFLTDNLDSEVYLDAVTLKQDSDPIVMEKEYSCSTKRVKGKNVILIGDVIYTGESFKEVRDLIMDNGALSVFGLFIAKVIKQK